VFVLLTGAKRMHKVPSGSAETIKINIELIKLKLYLNEKFVNHRKHQMECP